MPADLLRALFGNVTVPLGDPAGLCAGSLSLLKNLSGLGIGLPMKTATDGF
jgi:hypothetical protein